MDENEKKDIYFPSDEDIEQAGKKIYDCTELYNVLEPGEWDQAVVDTFINDVIYQVFHDQKDKIGSYNPYETDDADDPEVRAYSDTLESMIKDKVYEYWNNAKAEVAKRQETNEQQESADADKADEDDNIIKPDFGNQTEDTDEVEDEEPEREGPGVVTYQEADKYGKPIHIPRLVHAVGRIRNDIHMALDIMGVCYVDDLKQEDLHSDPDLIEKFTDAATDLLPMIRRILYGEFQCSPDEDTDDDYVLNYEEEFPVGSDEYEEFIASLELENDEKTKEAERWKSKYESLCNIIGLDPRFSTDSYTVINNSKKIQSLNRMIEEEADRNVYWKGKYMELCKETGHQPITYIEKKSDEESGPYKSFLYENPRKVKSKKKKHKK